jgi:hypothetical protein
MRRRFFGMLGRVILCPCDHLLMEHYITRVHRCLLLSLLIVDPQPGWLDWHLNTRPHHSRSHSLSPNQHYLVRPIVGLSEGSPTGTCKTLPRTTSRARFARIASFLFSPSPFFWRLDPSQAPERHSRGVTRTFPILPYNSR